MKIYGYRYMWLMEGSDSVNFKVVTDTVEGLQAFEQALLKLDGLKSAGKEYLHEYEVSSIGKFEKIFEKESEENEKSSD